MKFETTPLKDVLVIQPRVFGDERGFFLESWNQRAFADLGLEVGFVQDNHSRSRRGSLRGLHYQTECVQGKLVRAALGAVFDVVVDLRRSSHSFGQWFGVELNAERHNMLWVPPGFAHGFYVLSETADFLYKTTDYYHPESEISLRWDDPALAIDWPLLSGEAPLLSDKDRAGIAWADVPKFD
jgi:dTDP-4-dehydrorhamnose 3,5-epimerase